MGNGRKGFTIVELMVVVVIAILVTSITVRSIGAAQAAYSTRAARDVFVSLVSQARSQAIESGMATAVIAHAAGDSALILNAGGDNTIVNFDREFGVDLRMSTANIVICISPRGYASSACTNFTSVQTVAFQNNAEVDSLRLYPYGQMRY